MELRQKLPLFISSYPALSRCKINIFFHKWQMHGRINLCFSFKRRMLLATRFEAVLMFVWHWYGSFGVVEWFHFVC